METAILLSIAMPGLLAFVVMLAGIILARFSSNTGRHQRLQTLLQCAFGALAAGCGFMLAFHMVEGMPQFPPAVRWHWLAWLAAIASIIGVAHGLQVDRKTGSLLTGLMLAVATLLLFHPLPTTPHPWLWKSAVAAAVLLNWLSIAANQSTQEHRAGLITGITGPLLMLASYSVGAAIMLLVVNSAKFATLLASFACISAALALLRMLMQTHVMTIGAMAVLATLLPPWLATGWFYTQDNTPWLASIMTLTALSPALLSLPRLVLDIKAGSTRSGAVTAFQPRKENAA